MIEVEKGESVGKKSECKIRKMYRTELLWSMRYAFLRRNQTGKLNSKGKTDGVGRLTPHWLHHPPTGTQSIKFRSKDELWGARE